MLEQNPAFSDAYYILGVIAGENRQMSAAVNTLKKALNLNGEKAEYHAQIARFLLPTGNFEDAIKHAFKASELGSEDAYQLDTTGCVLSQTGFQSEAEKLFSQATRLTPENYQYHYNFGSTLRFLGKFDLAETEFESCIRLCPSHYQAHWALSQLKHQTEDCHHIERLKRASTQLDATPDAQSFLHYALGKEYEDLGKYDTAFNHYEQAASAHRSMISYDIQRDEALIETLIRTFDKDWFSRGKKGCVSGEPIFIFGLPRSGTTLVDRILSSHGEVSSGGELLNFGIKTKLMTGIRTPEFLDKETVEKAAFLDMDLLGKTYIESTRPITGNSLHFIDKLPFNFLYLGLLAKALPHAKFIHVRRGAMDSCFSMFKQRFAQAYNYSYSLEDMGKYYLLYSKLMDHWRRCLGARIYDIDYEKLVEDQETESRGLLHHCGLEWQEICLEFYKNESAVATASAAQVREPIYRTSLEKWRKFEQHLSPLKAVLEKGGVTV